MRRLVRTLLPVIAVACVGGPACSDGSEKSTPGSGGSGGANQDGGGASGGGAGTGGFAATGGATGSGGTSSGGRTGSGGTAGSASGGTGAAPTAQACTPAAQTGTWEGRRNCSTPEVDALLPQIGLPKAHNHSVMTHVLDAPMVAGSSFTYSISVASLDDMPVGVEIWGSTAACGGEVEMLAEQQLGEQTSYHGTVCATFRPTKAFTHVLLVVRTEEGFSHGSHTVCPAGTCQGTDGVNAPWPGKSKPFCDADEPEQCEACSDTRTCDAPVYTDNGDDTVTSSCCNLTWQKTVASGGVTHAAATAYCNALALAGGGWRMPTLAELLTLVDHDFTPAIDPVAFPGTSGGTYWSSTMDHLRKDEVNGIQFSNGVVTRTEPDRTTVVRCVR